MDVHYILRAALKCFYAFRQHCARPFHWRMIMSPQFGSLCSSPGWDSPPSPPFSLSTAKVEQETDTQQPEEKPITRKNKEQRIFDIFMI
jgi:hypothetical protein